MIFQGLLVICLCSYAFAAAEIKRTTFESNFKRYFPILILCLVLVQFSLAIVPTANVIGGQRCMLIDSRYVGPEFLPKFAYSRCPHCCC